MTRRHLDLKQLRANLEDCPDAIIIVLCDRVALTRWAFAIGNKDALLALTKDFQEFKSELSDVYIEIGFVQKLWKYLEEISKC